jgi:hypothetical protein
MEKVLIEKRIYTPQLSAVSSAAIRRLAWAKGKKMTKTLEPLFPAAL